MGLFTNKNELRDTKVKDAVLRLLYADDKSDEGKVKVLPIRIREDYNPEKDERDIENTIRTIYNEANFAYSNAIVRWLYDYDYIRKHTVEDRKNDLAYYRISKAGKQFFETQGFEKNLKDDYRNASENFYKWVTLGVALLAIVLPILYAALSDGNKDVVDSLHSIKVSIDSLPTSYGKQRLQPIDTTIMQQQAN